MGKVLCVGLDPDITKIPGAMAFGRTDQAEAQFELCKHVVDETAELALAFKPQAGFFGQTRAYDCLAGLITYIQERYPDIPVILDFKRGDIGNTSKAYAAEGFSADVFRADAVTLSPYLGFDGFEPFLEDPDKFGFLLCKTSNPGSGQLQDRWARLENDDERAALGTDNEPDHARNYELVAYMAATSWNKKNNNVGLVVGATYPAELARVRSIVGNEMEILAPGVGAQGADPAEAMQAGGEHLIMPSSSSIMFPKTGTIREAAQALHDQLTAHQAA